MNEREQVITLAMMPKTAADEGGFDVGKLLKNPITQYTLGGMGAGGLASVLRSIMGRPDPGMEGSALSRFLRATALGGLAGAGVSGGAKLMGYDLPTVGGGEKKVDRPGILQALGVGIPAGAAGLGTLLLLRGRAKNRILSSKIGGKQGMLAAMKSLAKKSSPEMAKRINRIYRRVQAVPENWSTVGGLASPVNIKLPGGFPKLNPANGTWSRVRPRQVPVFGRMSSLWGQASGQSPQLMMLKRMIKRQAGSPAGTNVGRLMHSVPELGKKGKFKFDKMQARDFDAEMNPLLRLGVGGKWPLVTAPMVAGPATAVTLGTMLGGEEG